MAMRAVGNLSITVTTDYYGNIFEYDNAVVPGGHEIAEGDNSAGTTATATLADYSNLESPNLAVSPSSVQSGGQLTVTWNDSNTGAGDAAKAFYDRISVVNTTTGQTILTQDLYYDATQPGKAIPAGGMSAQRQYLLSLPHGDVSVGTLQVTITTDYYNQVFEYDNGTVPGGHAVAENNNAASASATATLRAVSRLEGRQSRP